MYEWTINCKSDSEKFITCNGFDKGFRFHENLNLVVILCLPESGALLSFL